MNRKQFTKLPVSVSHEMVEGFRFERVSFECLNFSLALVSEWICAPYALTQQVLFFLAKTQKSTNNRSSHFGLIEENIELSHIV